MVISNATAILTNVSVGRHDGSTGTLTLQNGAQLFTLDALSIGRFSNSVGHVFVQGGLLSLTNDVIWVGREGTGDMTISNGTVRAKGALVALSTVVTDAVSLVVVTNMPSGSLTIAGAACCSRQISSSGRPHFDRSGNHGRRQSFNHRQRQSRPPERL